MQAHYHNARNYLIAIMRLELGPNRMLCELLNEAALFNLIL